MILVNQMSNEKIVVRNEFKSEMKSLITDLKGLKNKIDAIENILPC